VPTTHSPDCPSSHPLTPTHPPTHPLTYLPIIATTLARLLHSFIRTRTNRANRTNRTDACSCSSFATSSPAARQTFRLRFRQSTPFTGSLLQARRTRHRRKRPRPKEEGSCSSRPPSLLSYSVFMVVTLPTQYLLVFVFFFSFFFSTWFSRKVCARFVCTLLAIAATLLRHGHC
jgi:hypothetical protein